MSLKYGKKPNAKRYRLTDKEKKFTEVYLANGKNATKAALEAYNTDKYSVATAIGHENLKKAKVQAMITDFAETAQARIQELAIQDKNLTVALYASKDVLDRAGMKPVEKQAIAGNLKVEWAT